MKDEGDTDEGERRKDEDSAEDPSDSSFILPPSSLLDHAALFIGPSLTAAAIVPAGVVPMVTTNVP
jgi:hypothetical protein